MLINTHGFLAEVEFTSPTVVAFATLVYLTYSFIYLLPAMLVVLAAYAILAKRGHSVDGVPKVLRTTLYAMAVLLAATTQILIFIDKLVYGMFGYHFNGFVWNLVSTPGGIESMGGGSTTQIETAVVMLVFLALEAGVAMLSFRGRTAAFFQRFLTRRVFAVFLVFIVAASVAERLTYAWGAVKANTAIMISSDAFPFYTTTNMRNFATKLGIETVKRADRRVKMSDSDILYPLKPLVVKPPEKKMNILWLTAESLRADMLDPEIMPATYAFAQQSHRFNQHYSGGNGTRMGMFALFYGLYGNYWFPFLAEERAPVLFDVLRNQNYQFKIHTSAKFAYPEFDRTIFSGIPRAQMHEAKMGPSWRRDRANTVLITKFLRARDKTRPFMAFIFFESPHASYDFPPESIIRTPYLDTLAYTTVDLKRDIGLIKNRYINSVHHLDSQIARLLEELTAQNLLEDTIVVISGDHGEEFMEKGHWGHNSYFTQEQTLTPLVLWIPGTGSSTTDAITSHLDIVPTIMPFLGVQNPPEDYSLGFDLLGEKKRTYTVIADWSSICFVDESYKTVIAFKGGGNGLNETTTKDDGPVLDKEAYESEFDNALRSISKELSRFLEKREVKQKKPAVPAGGG